jgi:hypothetical protein
MFHNDMMLSDGNQSKRLGLCVTASAASCGHWQREMKGREEGVRIPIIQKTPG